MKARGQRVDKMAGQLLDQLVDQQWQGGMANMKPRGQAETWADGGKCSEELEQWEMHRNVRSPGFGANSEVKGWEIDL